MRAIGTQGRISATHPGKMRKIPPKLLRLTKYVDSGVG